MPPGRVARRGLVTNENDENSGSTRMTRAKAAQLNVDELSQPSKPLQSKKSAVNTNPQAGRKRAALGDLNVNKSDVSDVKKPVASGKLGLVSKAAPPSRVQKSSSTATSSRRAAVAPKEPVKKQLKRSGPGDIAARRAEAASAPAPSVAKENTPAEEREPVRKKVHTLEKVRKVAVEEEVITKTVTTEPEPEDSVTLGAEAAEDTVDEYPPGVKNLDEEDLDDPLMVAEYATEIFKYLGELECKSLANPDYMSHQDDLEWKTRGILIDWLVEVHTRFHLLPETLFLAINIIDRFLTEKIVQLDRLQLVGVTAMFIASKYEEVLSPHVGNFRHVADDGFTEAEILSAERFILSTLNYNLSYPNPMNFLRRISKADNYDIQSRTIGKYLMEISLLDHRFMEYRPSHVAAGAMFLARRILDRGEWDPTLSYYAGYTEDEIMPVVSLMVDYLARPVVHEAFFKKYASKKFLKASILTRHWAKKNAAEFGLTEEDLAISIDQI